MFTVQFYGAHMFQSALTEQWFWRACDIVHGWDQSTKIEVISDVETLCLQLLIIENYSSCKLVLAGDGIYLCRGFRDTYACG